jgi:hypothetical protein
MNTRLLDYRPELEFLPPSTDAAHTAHQNELTAAAELLEVASEAELNGFLSTLMGKGAAMGRAVLATPQGRALRRALARGLQQAAHIALPLPARGIAGPVIDALSRSSDEEMQRCARIFGLELEGLSPEDEEFELARRFVHYATTTGREAARLLSRAPALPLSAVHDAALTALAQGARRCAPGLLAHCPKCGRSHRQD